MRFQSKLFYSYVLFLCLYAGFILLPAPQKAVLAQYHLSPTGLRLIDLTIVILMGIIWFAGFYGFSKMESYTSFIRGEKDGKQIAKLTTGIFFLVMWLPVSSVISAILNFFVTRHPSMLSSVTVINNYVSLAIPLVGFVCISRGAHGLGLLIRKRANYKVLHALVLLVIYLGLIYYHMVISTYQRDAVYHLSLWWLLLTFIAPYIYMWFTGFIATYYIYHYRQNVKGIVYRRALSLLALGIGWLITMSIGFQYLSTLTAHLSSWSIYALLALIYGVLLVLAVGFILIATGARKLQRIEEV